MEQRNHITKVHIRTAGTSFVGSLSLPMNTRLKEFINRNDVWLALSRVQVAALDQEGASIPKRLEEIRLQKIHIRYMTMLSEDVRSNKTKVYERDVIGARMRKEVFCFLLTGGILISGEVVGGEATITHHRAGFAAVTRPKISDLRCGDVALEPDFVLINLTAVEYYEKRTGAGDSDLRCVLEEKAEFPLREESMDFSDLETQFITIDSSSNAGTEQP